MLTLDIARALDQHLMHLIYPLELRVSPGRDETLSRLASELAAHAPDRISVTIDVEQGEHASLRIIRLGTDVAVRFVGLPLGQQFSTLVLALLHVGGHPPRYPPERLHQAATLEGRFDFETYFAQDCQSCPETVQALNALAVLNPNVSHTAIDGALFPERMMEYDVRAVPAVFLNGERFTDGRKGLEQILDRLAPETEAHHDTDR